MNQHMKPTSNALEAWIVEAAELALPSAPLQVPAKNERRFLTTYGVCRQSVDYSLAYVTTAANGFPYEAETLARAAFEHAVTAQWCFLTPDGHDLLVAGLRASAHQFHVRVASRGGHDEWLAELAEDVPSDRHGRPNFTKMMAAVDFDDFLGTIYATLSQATHVTARAVSSYLYAGAERFELIEERSISDAVRYQGLHAAAMSSLLAVSVLAHIIEDEALLSLVSRRSDELQLPWLLESGSVPDPSSLT